MGTRSRAGQDAPVRPRRGLWQIGESQLLSPSVPARVTQIEFAAECPIEQSLRRSVGCRTCDFYTPKNGLGGRNQPRIHVHDSILFLTRTKWYRQAPDLRRVNSRTCRAMNIARKEFVATSRRKLHGEVQRIHSCNRPDREAVSLGNRLRFQIPGQYTDADLILNERRED